MLPNATLPHTSFHTRASRLAAARDLAVIGVCLALIIGFLAQIWRASPPPMPAADPAAIHAAA